MQGPITTVMMHAKLEEMRRRNLARQSGEAASTGTPKPRGVCDRRRLELCGVYERYRGVSFETIEDRGVPEEIRPQVDRVEDYADHIEDNLQDGVGLILRGPAGTLKTSLAVAALRSCLEAGRNAKFIPVTSLIDAFFSARTMPAGDWAALDAKLRGVSLLVLDDLGVEWSEGWAMTKLAAIFTERYNRRRSTIITTNLGTDEMRRRYPERIIDRLRATSRVITFNLPRSLRESCV